MKIQSLKGNNPRLHSDELLVALAIISRDSNECRRAIEQLPRLKGAQVHTSVMLSEVAKKIMKKLGIDFTSEPITKKSQF